MAKERKKKNPPQSTIPINVSLPIGMSAEEMQHVIAKAMVEAEELKEQKKNLLTKMVLNYLVKLKIRQKNLQ